MITADVCVIGGGPAGSTTACRLASFGYRVILVEREAIPRTRSGASLPSSILPLLEVIGACHCLEHAGFLRPEQIVVWWADERPSVRSLPGLPGFHVDRLRFDDLLLRNAEANGATVLRPAQATHVQRSGGRGWRVRVGHDGRQKEIMAPFLVDAAGVRPILPGRRIRNSAPLLSLFAQWSLYGHKRVEGCVEAGENEWLWYAPVGDGKSVAAVFVDPKRLSDNSYESLENTYFNILRRFRLFREHEAGFLEGEITACDASSRHAEHAAGPDFVRVGDANMTLDPLSSQGIQNAVVSGIQAAAVINTLAKYPANAKDAIVFYHERQTEKVSQYAAKTAELYQARAIICGRPFWQQRAAGETLAMLEPPTLETRKLEPTCKLELSTLAAIEPTPVIQGDMITSTPTIRHRALGRPLAFLAEIELVPLLRQIRSGQSAISIVEAWSAELSADLCWHMLHWLWHRRIVVPAANS